MRPITLLFVHQSADLYGSDKMLLNLLDGLDPQRHTRIVVLPEPGPLVAALEARGIETHVAEAAKVRRSMFSLRGIREAASRMFSSVNALDAVAAGRRVDIVHSNTLAVLGGALWATLRRVRHVWHVHEILMRPRSLAYAYPFLLWLLADLVVANSQATGRALTARLPGLARKLRVIPNGIALPARATGPAAAAQRQAFQAGPGDIVVTLVGRVNRWKGHAVLLAAFEALAPRFPHIRLALVGSPPPGQPEHLDNLLRLVAATPCRERVTVCAFVDDVAAVWAATDIAVVPSTDPEPFGMVAVEAMACGVPVVAADHGGLPEIVEHGTTGLLVAPGSPQDLSHALARLISDPELRAAMGRNGKARAELLFGAARFQKEFAAAYAALLPPSDAR